MSNYTAYTGTWVLDPTHSEIGFVTRHAMVTKVRGKFNEFEGTIVIDGENPANSSAKFVAQLASIDTGNEQRDGHLKGADFFDTDNNKSLEFTSTSVKLDGDEGVLVGDLTIKGATQPVTIKFDINGLAKDPFGNERAGFEGKTEISRKDFGLTWNVALETGGFLVSDEIKIHLDLSAIKQA